MKIFHVIGHRGELRWRRRNPIGHLYVKWRAKAHSTIGSTRLGGVGFSPPSNLKSPLTQVSQSSCSEARQIRLVAGRRAEACRRVKSAPQLNKVPVGTSVASR